MATTKRVTPRRAIPIPDQLWQAVLALAEREHMTASALVRRALVDAVENGHSGTRGHKASRVQSPRK